MRRLFIALILLSLTCGSYAAEVDNLYQASAPVSSRDEQERATLTPELLRQVMLKVVGNQSLLDSAALEPVLAKAVSFMQQYEYQRSNIVADLTRPDKLSLKLSFEPAAVNTAIRELNLPIWGKIRPDILVWLAVSHEGQQSLLGLESDEAGIFRPLSQAADSRGLPVLMPLMDLSDQSALKFNDVWQTQQSIIKTASQRYGADVILSARVNLQGDEAQIDWQAMGDSISDSWHSQGSLQQALNEGMGQLADKLALSYSQQVSNDAPEQQLNLQITNVLGFADYNRLMNYLQQLDLITDIRVNNLNEQQLDLDIAYRGSVELLQRTLAVGRMLAEENGFDNSNIRHYRLVP